MKNILVIFCVLSVTLGQKSFPNYIEKCHQNDPQVKSCYINAVESVKSHFSAGIPEFGLPTLDPLILPLISLDNGPSFKAYFKNIEIYHMEELHVKNMDVNLDENVISMDIAFPRLRIKSNYHIQGRILFLQLNGEGPADGNFTNVEAKITLSGKQYTRQGRTYLKLTNLEMKENLHRPVFRFDGLFRNNPELTEQTNKIVNENIVDIIDELRPAVHVAVNQTVIGMISRMFKKYTIDDLFPK